MATKVKNKHGRVGVKNYTPNRPLADDQKAEFFEKGFNKGREHGTKISLTNALGIVNGSKSIRDARRKLQEFFDAQT